MGLSVASLNPITGATTSFVASKPQTSSISNESAISSAYRESIKNTATPQGVLGPAPVQYASRRSLSAASSIQQSDNQRMTRAYNSIASAFGGANTSYGRDSVASSYDLTGQGVDLFA